jgi:hypothetical protein
MDENHDRTKEVLFSLNDEAYAIKKSVSDSQEELSITLEKFMIECGINKK